MFRDPSYKVFCEEEVTTKDELMEETSRYSFRDSCKYVLKNIPNNTSEDSYEE